MNVPVYITMCPGYDRPFVSTSPPHEALEKKPGMKVWRVDVEVPGFDKVDGVIRAVATAINSAARGDKEPLLAGEKHV